jgi:hypothetical protein
MIHPLIQVIPKQSMEKFLNGALSAIRAKDNGSPLMTQILTSNVTIGIKQNMTLSVQASHVRQYSSSRNKPHANVSLSEKDADNIDIHDKANLAQIDLTNSLNWRFDVSDDQDE